MSTRPAPTVTPDTQFFWDGVADHKLFIQRCTSCAALRHPPRPMCPTCNSLDWDTLESSGRGTLFSFVLPHHPQFPWFEPGYIVALVDLEEGTRLVSNLVGVDPDDATIGMAVEVFYEQYDDGLVFAQFRPAADSGGGRPMTDAALHWEDVTVGDVLPTLVIDMTATRIVAGAIASRDFMPVHHDRDYANAQGAPDIFMNILSDTGHTSRFLTDWAGPEAMIKKLSIRLGVPVFPGHTLTYDGTVIDVRLSDEGDAAAAGLVEVELRAVGDLGDHVTGTAVLDLPRRHAGPTAGDDA